MKTKQEEKIVWNRERDLLRERREEKKDKRAISGEKIIEDTVPKMRKLKVMMTQALKFTPH